MTEYEWSPFVWGDLLDNYDDNLHSHLKESVKSLHDQSSRLHDEYETLRNKNTSLNEIIASTNKNLSTQSIDDKITQHKRLQNAINLVVLESKLDKLCRYKHIKQIPDLVLELLSVEKTIFCLLADNLLMKTVLIETMDEMKLKISESFNVEFEDHLLIENVNSTEDNSNTAMTTQKWLYFLSIAVDSILSYVVISILPTTSIILSSEKEIDDVNKSDDLIVYERYKESLDNILIPLWSKFHFHLSTAREEKSTEQLLWTFKYTASFVGIIIQLCDKLGSASILQNIYKGNYRQINYDYIYSTSLRFLRAHISQCIVFLSKEIALSEKNRDIIQFIENVTQLDDNLRIILNQKYQKCETPLSSVLCNAPFIHQLWLDIDTDYIKQKEIKCLCKSSMYDLKFGNSIHSRYKCYGSLYESFSLFLIFCNRYQYNSAQSQQTFSRHIIEPLLCTCVAILWFKVKSSENLRNISNGIIKHGKAEFEEFCECCDYLIACLDKFPTDLRNIAVIGGFEYTINETKKRIQEDEQMLLGLFDMVLKIGKVNKLEKIGSILDTSIEIAKLAIIKLSTTLKRKVEAGLNVLMY